MFPYYLFYIPICLLAWAVVFPEHTVITIQNIKQSLHTYIATYIARREIHFLRARFQKWGKQNGFDLKLVDEVFNEHSPELLQRIEARYSGVSIDELLSDCD